MIMNKLRKGIATVLCVFAFVGSVNAELVKEDILGSWEFKMDMDDSSMSGCITFYDDDSLLNELYIRIGDTEMKISEEKESYSIKGDVVVTTDKDGKHFNYEYKDGVLVNSVNEYQRKEGYEPTVTKISQPDNNQKMVDYVISVIGLLGLTERDVESACVRKYDTVEEAEALVSDTPGIISFPEKGYFCVVKAGDNDFLVVTDRKKNAAYIGDIKTLEQLSDSIEEKPETLDERLAIAKEQLLVASVVFMGNFSASSVVTGDTSKNSWQRVTLE